MGWDFSTDPEYQQKLDWVARFCREEIEPLEHVFPHAVRSREPKIRALVKELQQQVKDQGLWAIFLDRDLGGPGYGQLQLALLNEILGRYPSRTADVRCGGPGHRKHGDARRLRHRGAEGAVAPSHARPGAVVGLLDDRTPGWIGSRTCSGPTPSGTATSG